MENQAKYKRFIDDINSNWSSFVKKRNDLLIQQKRYGKISEKATLKILNVLFTEILDWDIKDINDEVDYADIVITKLGIKRIIIEAKRPYGISWNEFQIEKHIDQANRYASEQKVNIIAISDGKYLLVFNVDEGSRDPRILIDLESDEPNCDLYYISVNGVDKKKNTNVNWENIKNPKLIKNIEKEIDSELINKTYKLPSRCFAYVGDPNKPSTWKLPYLSLDGSVNIKRLPGAVECVVTNFRGLQIKTIPEENINEVLIKLAKASKSVGKLNPNNPKMANCYKQLYKAIDQIGALDKI